MFDWITIILVLLIAGIILDGVRRVRESRRSNIKLSRNAKKADIEWGSDEQQAQPDHPSASPRVVAYREESEAREHTENLKNNFHTNRVVLGSSSKIPEQVSLSLEESVPMLMESIELQAQSDAQKNQHIKATDTEGFYNASAVENSVELLDDTKTCPEVPSVKASVSRDFTANDHIEMDDGKGFEPTIGSLDELDALDEDVEQGESRYSQHEAEDKSHVNTRSTFTENTESDEDSFTDAEASDTKKETLSERIHKKIDAFTSDRKSSDTQKNGLVNNLNEDSMDTEKGNETQNTSKNDPHKAEYVDPDEVIVVNIMALPGEQFAGELLLNALMDEGMKLGNMDIFHRHHQNNGDAPVVFSLANMVVPGTFNLAKMNEFSTPGVSMFLGLPVVGDSLAAYHDLIVTAQNIAHAIGGELKDENRSVMTKQTIEHSKQRVIEYERKKKLARA